METTLLQPPVDVPEIQRGNWLQLPDADPLVEYIGRELWDLPRLPTTWETARLSHAVYLYRESPSGWYIAAKFYTVKTGEGAEKYAAQEAHLTEQAIEALHPTGDFRVARPRGLWRGVLFLEYIDGITLEDVIAIRRSRPGTLLPALERTAALLANLHTGTRQPETASDFEPNVVYAKKLVQELGKYGVLQADPLVHAGLERLLDRWIERSDMNAYTPCLNHGDATTTNFVFPANGSPTAIDWERARLADPAFDLGRFMAEASHSISHHGGSPAEALPFIEHIAASYTRAYVNTGADPQEVKSILSRAGFYQAASTLRIARNGWISRTGRLGLVAQAFALLVDYQG
jgi:aminoglycoside phosphotransferase (APT) family kinase protein